MISRNLAPLPVSLTRYHTTVVACMISWFTTHMAGYFSVQPANSLHQHRLADDLACNYQFERCCSLLQWQPMGDIRCNAPGGKPAHEGCEIPLLPGRVKAAQAANS